MLRALTPFILIAVSIAGYFFYIGPTLGEISSLRTKSVAYKSVLEKSREMRAKRDSIMETLAAVPAEDIQKIDKLLPDKFDGVVFLNDMNALALASGLTVVSLKASSDADALAESAGQIQATDGTDVPPPSPSTYKTASVSFVVNGSYDQFVGFLKNLESSLRLIDVVNMSIKEGSANKKGTDESESVPGTVLSYSFDIMTYYIH